MAPFFIVVDKKIFLAILGCDNLLNTSIMARKNKRSRLVQTIRQMLQADFDISANELRADFFYSGDAYLRPSDVSPFIESQYGVSLRNLQVNNWKEFSDVVADLILKKK